MVFIKSRSESYLQILGTLQLGPDKCFWFYNSLSGFLHTVTTFPRIYIAYNRTTVDPTEAVALNVFNNDNGTYTFQYRLTLEYWSVDDCKITTTRDKNIAASFFADRWVENEIDIDTILINIFEKGYAIIPSVISGEYAEELKKYLRLSTETDQSQVRRGNLLELSPEFTKILCHSSIVNIVRACLNPNAKCGTWSSNTLYETDKADPTYNWHVDYPYHDMQAPWRPEPLSVQVLWCLDDFTYENGATLFVRDSHVACTFPTTNNMINAQYHVEILTASKGSVVISHGGWWHSQGINRTRNPRTCLLGTFIQPWIKPKDDMGSQYNALPDDHPMKQELYPIIH